MRRTLFLIMGLFWAFSWMAAQDIESAMAALAAKGKARNVRIEVSDTWLSSGKVPVSEKRDSSCSGVIIETGWVLTMNHCFEDHFWVKGEIKERREITVWGRPARVKRSSEKLDLALVSIEPGVIDFPLVEIADAEIGKPVVLVGTRILEEKKGNQIIERKQSFTNKVNYGVALKFEDCITFWLELQCTQLVTDAMFLPGFSGGGYWNLKGQLVGIGLGFEEYGEHSIAVSAKDIREFLKDMPPPKAIKASK